MCHNLGGNVASGNVAEYGNTTMNILKESRLFKDCTKSNTVWMSHRDKVKAIPEGFECIATSKGCEFAAVENKDKNLFGIQFHPEVSHTNDGMKIIDNFVKLSNIEQNWKMSDLKSEFINNIRAMVGKSHVIGAISGGVDSSVASLLMKEAIGDRFHAVLVDNGLLRKNEAVEVYNRLAKDLGIDVHTANSQDLFLTKLKGVIDPEQKRKIIGNSFIDVFQD